MNDFKYESKSSNFCKQYGFIFQSEMYMVDCYGDFGPVGALLKDNIACFNGNITKFVKIKYCSLAELSKSLTSRCDIRMPTFSDIKTICRSVDRAVRECLCGFVEECVNIVE